MTEFDFLIHVGCETQPNVVEDVVQRVNKPAEKERIGIFLAEGSVQTPPLTCRKDKKQNGQYVDGQRLRKGHATHRKIRELEERKQGVQTCRQSKQQTHTKDDLSYAHDPRDRDVKWNGKIFYIENKKGSGLELKDLPEKKL